MADTGQSAHIDQPAGQRQHLGSLLTDMEAWGNLPAVVEHRGVRRFTTSYAAVATLAHRFACELARRGIGPGDRVVLCGRNSATWIAAFFGCVEAGVLAVPLDATGSVEFARRVLQEVSPKLVVADAALGSSLSSAEPQLVLETLAAHLPPKGTDFARPALTGSTPLQILFTSGTTGAPKGIVHTHRNLLASLLPIEREVRKYERYARLVGPLRILHTLPLSHVFGQFMGLWVPPLLGATVVYESRSAGSRIARLIPEERIHVLAAVPRTLDLLRAHLLAEDPSLAASIAAAQGQPIAARWWRFRGVHWQMGLRFWAAVCGGATLPASVEQFWTTLGFPVIQGYGLTETSALVTLNHPFKIAKGSLGTPLPGRSLRVSASGELEVKGDMVSTAAWQNGTLVERADPWLPTGDLASLDPDGRVRFLGRSGQRLVTAAGLNVYLQDVEAALESQDGIDEAVALPVSGADGEVPGAVIVARSGDAAARHAVAQANSTLQPHQQVRQWWLWPELALPRTGSGKVARNAVQSWVAAQKTVSPGPTTSDGGATDPLRALLLSVGASPGPLDDAARLDEDWGLDSMGRVALAAALEEQTGVAPYESEPLQLQTLGDLRAMFRGARVLTEPGASVRTHTISSGVDHNSEASAPTGGLTEDQQPAPSAMSVQKHAGSLYRYPRWPWRWPATWLRIGFIECLLRPLVWLLGGPRVMRLTTRQPMQPPLLIVSNHRSAMDVPLLLYALPSGVRRRVAVAMSGEMLAGWQQSWSMRVFPAALQEHRRWWGPIAAFLLQALLNVFPLPRTVGFRASFEHAGKALNRGYSVLIFPEGRRSAGGELQPFKAGLGVLAAEALVPALPAALLMDATPARRGSIAIILGTVTEPAAEASRTTAMLYAQVHDLIRSAASGEASAS